jgi:hypothetical protein
MEFESADVPLEPVCQLSGGTVGRPMLRVRHVGEVVCKGNRIVSAVFHIVACAGDKIMMRIRLTGPVGKVQRESFVSTSPVVTDSLVAFYDQTSDSQSLQACSEHETTIRLQRSLACDPVARSSKMTTHFCPPPMIKTSGSTSCNSRSISLCLSHAWGPVMCPSLSGISGNPCNDSIVEVNVQIL